MNPFIQASSFRFGAAADKTLSDGSSSVETPDKENAGCMNNITERRKPRLQRSRLGPPLRRRQHEAVEQEQEREREDESEQSRQDELSVQDAELVLEANSSKEDLASSAGLQTEPQRIVEDRVIETLNVEPILSEEKRMTLEGYAASTTPSFKVVSQPTSSSPPSSAFSDSHSFGTESNKSPLSASYFQFNGRQYWKIGAVVGVGATSRIYRVFDAEGRFYALKRVSPESFYQENGSSGTQRDREKLLNACRSEVSLYRKIQAHSRHQPSRIMRVLEVDEKADGTIDILMLLGEKDLAHLLKDQISHLSLPFDLSMRPIPFNELSAFCAAISHRLSLISFYWRQMILAVLELHDTYGIIHCDLKPSNFVLYENKLLLVDLGIAKEIPPSRTAIYINKDLQMGTVSYMSPESFMEVERTDEMNAADKASGTKWIQMSTSADVWSLGCILYEMCYGKSHLTGQSLVDRIHYLMLLGKRASKQQPSVALPFFGAYEEQLEQLLHELKDDATVSHATVLALQLLRDRIANVKRVLSVCLMIRPIDRPSLSDLTSLSAF